MRRALFVLAFLLACLGLANTAEAAPSPFNKTCTFLENEWYTWYICDKGNVRWTTQTDKRDGCWELWRERFNRPLPDLTVMKEGC